MFWDDFRLFCQDFAIAPQQMSESEAAQIFHAVPTRHLTFEDFVGPQILGQIVWRITTGDENKLAPGLHSVHAPYGFDGHPGPYADVAPEAMEHFLSEIRDHSAMKTAMEWYDDTYGKNAIHRRERQDHVGCLRQDPTRMDQPVRPNVTYDEALAKERKKAKKTLDAHTDKRHSESIHPGPDKLRNQQSNPFLSELKERQRAIQRSEPLSQSHSHSYTLRAPAPYGREPSQSDAQYASDLLDAMCRAHRIDLQLLFDNYGQREADHGRGVMIGEDLHQLVWDGGLIGQGHRQGVTKSIKAFFEKCVGQAFRENLRVSFDRFKIMLIRAAEWMASQRDPLHPNKWLDVAMADLIRDYVGPLVHAKFWKEYYGQTHLPRQ